ncbi:MAG TPA: hypothetical protein VLY46_04380, partial [Usitatibacter sp.]|nr:hypothetical protein [Usitatibacter sp.]
MSEPAPAAARSDPPRDRVARALAIVAIAAAIAVGWLAVQARVGVSSVRASAGGRLAELGAESERARA